MKAKPKTKRARRAARLQFSNPQAVRRGSTLRCVDDDGASHWLTDGRRYKVTDLDVPTGQVWVVDDQGNEQGWHAHRFALVRY